MFETPARRRPGLLLLQGNPFCLASRFVFLEDPLIFRLCSRVEVATALTLHSPSLEPDNLASALGPPHDLAELNEFENNVDLHDGGIIDDLQQGHDVGVDGLLQDGHLLLDLVLGITQLPEASALGVSRDDLDGDLVALVQIPTELDLAVHATAQFVDDLILIEEFPTGDGIDVFVGDMRPRRKASCQWRSSSGDMPWRFQ